MQTLDFDHGRGLNFLSLKDRRRVLEALEKMTPDTPEVSFPVQVEMENAYHAQRLVMRTLWSRGGVYGVEPLYEAIRLADGRMYQNKAKRKKNMEE